MGRPKIKNKKEHLTVYLEPELMEEFKKYCEEQNIENFSDYIEQLIKKYKKEKL
jgi:hypothetical protein